MNSYCAAKSLEEALDVLAGHAGVCAVSIVAGGTDYFPAKPSRGALEKPQESLLDVTRIAELSEISETAAGWRIGAAVTFSALIATPFPAAFSALKQAARQIGARQIQNVATLAGNICNASPAADSVPVLLAMNAQVELASTRGRRVLDLADFIIGVRQTTLAPDEMLSAVLIPAPHPESCSAFEKLGSREYLVISIAMMAVVLRVTQEGPEKRRIAQARVAVGACGPVALRLPALESDLIGRSVADLSADFEVSEAHLAPLSPLDDVRGSAHYRKIAVAEIAMRAIERAAQDAS